MTPFATGYAEAALAELNGRRVRANSAGLDPYTVEELAPATYARIVEDCEAIIERTGWQDLTEAAGRLAWRLRQESTAFYGLTPLTPYTGDDLLIYFREAGQ